MGQAPPTGGISLRTGNRNFPGRSGTQGDDIYLVSPEIAAASALAGEFVDPTTIEQVIKIEAPTQYTIDDSGTIDTEGEAHDIKLPKITRQKTIKKILRNIN